MAAKSYLFDGEQMTRKEIQARYPAYTKHIIAAALTKMEPPATDRHGLDRWCAMLEANRRRGSQIAAALGRTQILINPKSNFWRAKKIQKEKNEWAMKQLAKRGKS